MKKTVYDHIKEVVESVEGKDFKSAYGFNLTEVKRSRKVAPGWHMQLNRTYTDGRTKVFNMFSKEYVECPVWFSKIYEEMLFSEMTMMGKINAETMAMFDFFKIALNIEDDDAYYALVD